MDVAFRKRSKIKLFLRGCQYCFLILGLTALGFCGISLLNMAWFQAHETHAFEQVLKRATDARNNVPSACPTAATAGLKPAVMPEGSVVGQLKIPRIGVAAIVLEGVDSRTLRRAVGHIPGTALPWQPGNVALAGHRDTFFRPLRKICRGDDITLKTLEGSYRYRVEFTQVVDPTDTAVLRPSPGPTLTLITCYPFYFIGSAPKRFVVSAYRLSQSD